MSDMLEQAIIDAAALKEAATKNAETLVLEKYSSQIKEAVETLLEQDELALGDMPSLGDPAVADPTGDPAAAMAAPEMSAEKSSVLEHIPLSVTADDDEQIEIPLDKLTEELAMLNESFRFGGDSHNISELFEHNLVEIDDSDLEEVVNEEELDEALELDEEDLSEELELEEDEASDEIINPDSMEEDINLDEDIIEAIAEQLTVDLPEANKGGWAGMPEKLIQLAEEELLAIEQDSKVKEHRAAMRKAVNQLENVKESLESKNQRLEETLKKASSQLIMSKEVILTLQNKLEESNLTNAKLLYQNKAMTSASLNERQKNKLVEAVSNAETIEEAKVIFETLQSTVGSTSRKSQPKSLSEAVQKSSSMILSARRDSKQQEKTNPTLNRWKFLAGIDK
jgi:hypothetical protein